jgi:glycosyltransferase involved in cell wall biosynthesis
LRHRREQSKLRAVSLCVLHIDTERGWRGGERQTLWLARELARRGYGTVVAARAGEPLYERAAAAGLTCVDCAPASEIDLVAAIRLRKSIRDHRVDLVHAHTAHAVAIAALATAGSGVPFVVSRRVDFGLRRNVGTRLKYGRAAMFIAISQAVSNVLVRSGVQPDRIRVVPDGVDVHRLVTPASADTLRATGVAGERPLVVQVAQLVSHKDPLTFVRAMARVHDEVPDAMALMVGDGPLRDDVEREIRALGLGSVVLLTGYRTDADALLAAATVATLSSSEEGMGSVLLDALAFGRPVAATRAGGIPEVIVDGVCGLLAPVRDPRALGDAIAALLRDDALRDRVASKTKARAADFSVEVMTDRTIDVYAEILRR